mmetsp:Transcript_16255/g.24086  ORF Transcript_16255/g.24086 Transcript_16255/m.24086 type:complete len:113 (-) Transcript_16255:804-1142(-)
MDAMHSARPLISLSSEMIYSVFIMKFSSRLTKQAFSSSSLLTSMASLAQIIAITTSRRLASSSGISKSLLAMTDGDIHKIDPVFQCKNKDRQQSEPFLQIDLRELVQVMAKE